MGFEAEKSTKIEFELIFLARYNEKSNFLAEIETLNYKFDTLVRFLRILVWPQEVPELTDGKKSKIIGENLEFVNY